ncbi:TonB family protein [Pedobacter insulae]|uniref:TonB family C-terminal domain-containing protein n=1 Tax=Pedobacter insulae TaxID=414048 RepID=A0A1I2YVL7_9SPHI|nr:TonB family protein [Pedobacter insulae]SFH29672.1 TonB family C-terminal domain-containing protein [Pedobacter insulae]
MSWAHYLLQVNIYLVVFFCFYKLLLDKETYFILNRIYLIGSGLLSLTIPFLRFEWLATQPVAQRMYTGVDQLSGFVSQVSIVDQSSEKFNWGNLVVAIYVSGIIFFIIRFIYQLKAVNKMFYNVNSGAAFSFLNRKAIAEDVPEPETIHLHEEIHIKQKHTIDVIFFELLAIFTWFNPIIYAYKYTVKNIHEFLADEAAANFQGDKETYSLLLLSQAFGARPSDLTNGFFTKSLIKKRIFMLHKQRSKKTAMLKYGLFVPLFALTLILSSATIRKNNRLIEVAEHIPLNDIKAAVTETIEPLRILNIEIAPRVYNTNPKIFNTAKNNLISNSNKAWDGFYNFLGNTIKYPKEAMNKQIEGDVRINFKVETGKIQDVNVVGDLGYQTKQEVKQSVLAFTKELPADDGNYSFITAFKLTQLTSKEEAIANEAPNGYNELPKLVVRGYATPAKKEGVIEENIVYSHVSMSSPPSYPGGIQKFYHWLANTIKYPSMATDNRVQGTIYISFTVEKDGTLTDIKADGRKLGYGLEEEATRVVKVSKRWNPGLLNGRPVRVKYNIPIKFAMPNETAKLKLTSSEPYNASLATSIKLKGSNLNQESNPLYIIDGEKQDHLAINNLKPETIESISILKDGSANSLYGIEGKNGVILITTKKESLTK